MLSGLVRDLVALAPTVDGVELEAQLAKDLAAVRITWPDAPQPGDAFATYVLARASAKVAALNRLRIGDVFLAWWCSLGDARAILAFEAAHAEPLRRLLQRFHRLEPDELRQLLRIKLFAGERPRILEYSGFGFLENWYKIIAARTFLDAVRARDRERTEDLPTDLELASPASTPRDAAVRAQVVAAVKNALDVAIAALPSRERTYLRHVLVDGLTVDQIAETYRRHRATVARTLAAARDQLRTATRGMLLDQLGSASALALLDSQIDLSLQRLFPERTQ